jgi:hypothetical protein
MSGLQLLVLAIAATAGLGSLRLARVHFGRTANPAARIPFIVAFVAIPPIALGALLQLGTSPLQGLTWLPRYAVIAFGVTALTWTASRGVRLVARGRPLHILMLALVGSAADSERALLDPPPTAKLVESMAAVERTNGVFPRGPEFPVQIERADFRSNWDALDAATTLLESRIADDLALGVGVASAARLAAWDARARLDTLRRLTVGRGMAWAR